MVTVPAPSASLPFLPAPAVEDEQPLGSEIETIQREHDLNKIPALLGLTIGIGTLLLTDVIVEDWACGMLVLVAALIPIQLWTRRQVLGIPIWPVVSLLSFAVYGVPFLASHPFTREYSFDEKIAAASTIAGVLFLITVLWAMLGKTRPLEVRIGRVVPPGAGTQFFLVCMALACAFQFNAVFGTIDIPSEAFGVLRAILFSLCTIALFSLSYDLGKKLLTRFETYAFLLLLTTYALSNMLTLYLYVALQIAFVSLLGYFLGGGKPPWKAMIAIAIAFSILQAGKASLRANYWSEEGREVRSIGAAVTFFSEWFSEGLHDLFVESNPTSDSLVQRGSVTQMVLKTQSESPQIVPFMNGDTYIAIPQLLIPRFIWPERPTTQQTLKMLSAHYGLQTLEEAETTSIAWGLVAEAFANFGYFGCLGLGVALGTLLGLIQRWCGRFPIKSARGLFALLVVTCMVNLEANAATLLTTFAQSTAALVLLAITVMRKQSIVG